VEGLLKDVFEEVLLEHQPREQEQREASVEDRDLDLHPHRVVRDQRQDAEDHCNTHAISGKIGRRFNTTSIAMTAML
jgi:hypothetical protein